jgi:hypothetical protein
MNEGKKKALQCIFYPPLILSAPEDVAEYMDILEDCWDVFEWNMAEMTTIKDEQFRIPVTDPAPVLRQQYRLSYAEKEIICRANGRA